MKLEKKFVFFPDFVQKKKVQVRFEAVMSRLLEDGDIYFLGGGVLVGALFTLGYQMIFSPKATKMTAKEKTSPEKTEPVAESPKVVEDERKMVCDSEF